MKSTKGILKLAVKLWGALNYNQEHNQTSRKAPICAKSEPTATDCVKLTYRLQQLKLDDPSANVPQMKIEFKGENNPVKVWQRTYSSQQSVFLKPKVIKLMWLGFIHKRSPSKWACAPHSVPKNKPEKLRFTTDLCSVNVQIMKNLKMMPETDAMFAEFTGAILLFFFIFPKVSDSFSLM